MPPNQETKQEQAKNPEQLNKETFDKINKEITELKDQDKNNDKIEGLDGKLSSSFFEHLKEPENSKGAKELYDAAKSITMDDTNTDKTILNTIITFLEPIANPINLGDTEVNKTDTGGTVDKFYNEIEKSKTETAGKITGLIGNIDKINSQDLVKLKSNLDKINKILNEENPKKEDVKSLQQFLANNLVGDNKTKFETSSFNKKGNPNAWDGKFGKGTMEALNAFISDNTTRVDGYEKAKTIANENDTKNTKVEAENNEKVQQEKIKATETNTDNESKKGLDEAGLAGTLTTKEVANLNDKTLKIDGDNVVYRGEKIPFVDLGIARNKTDISVDGGGGDASQQNGETNIIENNDALIMSYLDGSIKVNSGTIGINGKDSGLIVKALDTKKKEIDIKVDAKLKNSVVYNENTNNYEYKGSVKSRENIGSGEGKITLQDFQNEVDKKLISKNNEERTATTEVSTDQKTTRKVVDFVGDNGQKIVINKENDDGSSTKTVDVQRGDRTKVVETEKNKEGNVINKTVVKEDDDAFKERTKDKTILVKDKPEALNMFIEASGDDIVSAIKENNFSTEMAKTYEVQKDGLGRINISLRDGYKGLERGKFLKDFELILEKTGIANLNMENYKFKGEKINGKDVVTKLVFKLGEGTTKEVINPELKKLDQIKEVGKWETIADGIKGYEYTKTNGEMYARTKNEGNNNYQYLKYDQKTNNWTKVIDPYLISGGNKVSNDMA